MSIKGHCCQAMEQYIDPKCKDHPNPRDCPDALVTYDPRFDGYYLLPRFGESWVALISYCPWCGDAKRELRDEYFDRLEALGFDEPLSQEIPEEFRSDKWWKDARL